MIVLACTIGNKSRDRELTAKIDDLSKVGAVEVRNVPDFLLAVCQAEELTAAGQSVLVAGCLADFAVPEDCTAKGFGPIEWRESWLARLERGKIGFLPLATNEDRPTRREAVLATSVIRSFNRAARAMDEAICLLQQRESRNREERIAAETGYVCGRPPYGYRAVDGRLQIDKEKAKVVYFVFENYRATKSIRACAFAAIDAGFKGHWDCVKVRRILTHARLHCLGECSFRGKTVTLPDLAFLPAEWVDSYQPTKETP